VSGPDEEISHVRNFKSGRRRPPDRPGPDCAAADAVGAAIVAAGLGYGSPLAMPFLQTLQDEIFAGGPAAYLGQFWVDRATLENARAIVDNKIATLLWSSWGDITISGALNTFTALQAIEAARPQAGPRAPDVYDPMDPKSHASGRYQIIVGEGGHGAGLDTTIMLQWRFDTFVKNQNTGIDRVAKPLHLRERTRWVNARTYPLASDYTALYLDTASALSPQPAGNTGGASPWLMWDSRPEDPNGRLVYTSAPFANGGTLAGPIATTIYATSTNTNLQLIATLYNVPPDGTQTFITDVVLVGSQRAVDQGKSWVDPKGLMMRPLHTHKADDYLVANQAYRFDILLQPRLWPVEPGHSLRLALTTRPPRSAPCTPALSSTVCFNTTPQLQTLPAGAYQILADRQYRSSINLPLLPYRHFETVRSAVTETSRGVEMPMDWGQENEGHFGPNSN
jgi:uncharacterized protein